MMHPIKVENMSKRYWKNQAPRSWTFQDFMLSGFKNNKKGEPFWALKDVSFAVKQGEMLGVIGHNGAGKSTLLRLVGEIGKPDVGQVTTVGRIGALLGLGAGFHPELTGRENVAVNGVISGLTRKEVKDNFDSIVDFAEVEDFIDNPLHTYSSGMHMRLAFAIAIHIQPQVLLIDEVLAVGDESFRNKCFDRITHFKEQGCAILLVTHSIGFVQKYCDSALWLNAGQIREYGEPAPVVKNFRTAMQNKAQAIEANPVNPRAVLA